MTNTHVKAILWTLNFVVSIVAAVLEVQGNYRASTNVYKLNLMILCTLTVTD